MGYFTGSIPLNVNSKPFAEAMKTGPALIGTLLSMASLDAADVLSRCGFDWLFLDLEHSGMSTSEAKSLLQVIGDRAFVLARVGENSALEIKKALDMGCDGVIVPLVNSKQQAEAAVKAAKYPPAGERSVGIGRAQGYGVSLREYLSRANDEIALILQVEHRLAVESLDEILSVEGVDGLFIGPYDLSGSMGLIGNVTHERVRDALQSVRSKCESGGMPYGIFGMTSETCAEEIRLGARFVAMGIDTMHLFNGAKSQLDHLRTK